MRETRLIFWRASVLAAILELGALCAAAQAPAPAPAAPQGAARSEDARTELERMARRYRSMTSGRFEGYTTSQAEGRPTGGAANRRAFAVSFARPNKVRQEALSRTAALIVSDGATTWIYRPQFQQYKIVPRGSAYALPPIERLKSADVRLRSARRLADETLDIDGQRIATHVIEATYDPDPDEESNRPTVTYWIDAARAVIVQERALVVAVDGQATPTPRLTETTVYTRVEIDPVLPAEHFVFDPAASDVLVDEFRDPTHVDLTGQPAPAFSLPALDGRQVSLRDLRGKIVVLDFWATWCKPCVVEMPILQKLSLELDPKDVVVLGINNEAPETARAFLDSHQVTFTTLTDARSDVARQYAISGIPVGAVIDREGVIRAYFVGLREEPVWREALARVGITIPRP